MLVWTLGAHFCVKGHKQNKGGDYSGRWLGWGRNARAGMGDKQLTTNGFPLCSFASADGVPFLMHDEELTRTTNVQAVFPERAALNSTAFNWTDLQQLDAGSWFLEVRNVLRVAGEEWVHFGVKH